MVNGMDRRLFLHEMQQLAHFPSDEKALELARVTLAVLAARIGKPSAQILIHHLPPDLADALNEGSEANLFSLEEFFERIQSRVDGAAKDVVPQVRAVCEVLTHAVPPRELDRALGALPDDFGQLFDAGPTRGASRSELSL